MANRAQAWGVLGQAANLSPATLSKIDRSGLPENYKLKGGSGGGKNTVHVNLPYLSALAVAMNAPLPSSAGAFVRSFASVLCVSHIRETLEQDEDAPPGLYRGTRRFSGFPQPENVCQSILDFVAHEIAYWATQPAGARQDALVSPEALGSIRFDADALTAEVSFLNDEGSRTVIRFADRSREAEPGLLSGVAPDKSRPVAPIRRGTTMPMALLVVAGSILADSWAQTGERLPFSGQGEAQTKAHPENEKAPDLPGSRASRSKNQPRENHAAGHYSDNRQTKRECVNYQAHTVPRGIANPPMEMPHAHEVRPA